MDKKQKKLTPRMEKRLKYFHEKKNLSRVTRAKTGTTNNINSSTGNSAPNATETVSNRGFKTKLPTSQDDKKKMGKPSPKKSNNDKITDKKNGANISKKEKNTGSKAKVKKDDVSNEKGTEKEQSGKQTPKKTVQIVDAVEKLESTTSVHTPKRYVLFVGNLPKDITKEQVEEHFRKTGGVKAVRIPKQKGSEESRGFAYVEFNSTISHRIALRLHNTTLAGRKINVEFTSQGKKTEKKTEHLKERNEKLAKFKMPFDT